jgi:hypothetical protein
MPSGSDIPFSPAHAATMKSQCDLTEPGSDSQEALRQIAPSRLKDMSTFETMRIFGDRTDLLSEVRG